MGKPVGVVSRMGFLSTPDFLPLQPPSEMGCEVGPLPTLQMSRLRPWESCGKSKVKPKEMTVWAGAPSPYCPAEAGGGRLKSPEICTEVKPPNPP